MYCCASKYSYCFSKYLYKYCIYEWLFDLYEKFSLEIGWLHFSGHWYPDRQTDFSYETIKKRKKYKTSHNILECVLGNNKLYKHLFNICFHSCETKLKLATNSFKWIVTPTYSTKTSAIQTPEDWMQIVVYFWFWNYETPKRIWKLKSTKNK